MRPPEGRGTCAPRQVGSHPGLGDFGTYDMVGNVKEWCCALWHRGRHGRGPLAHDRRHPRRLGRDPAARRALGATAAFAFGAF